MIKFAAEGYPFMIVSGLLTIAVGIIFGSVYALPLLAVTLFMFYFFRDPERNIPPDKDVFVSPADGKVFISVDVREPKYIGADMRQVSIFMSPLNVHVNRAPCDGKVKKVVHNKGLYLAAYREDSSIRNENIEMVLDTAYGDILVRQVAGYVARRAVCRKREGDVLSRGERYGIIKFSSRLDIYLPMNAVVAVKPGDRVLAGETIIARVA